MTEGMIQTAFRLTPGQRDKVAENGGAAWVRGLIDNAGKPQPHTQPEPKQKQEATCQPDPDTHDGPRILLHEEAAEIQRQMSQPQVKQRYEETDPQHRKYNQEAVTTSRGFNIAKQLPPNTDPNYTDPLDILFE